MKKYTYKSENTLTTLFNTKKIVTFIITLKNIPAKLTSPPNIQITPFQGDAKKTWRIIKEVINKACKTQSLLPCKTIVNKSE